MSKIKYIALILTISLSISHYAIASYLYTWQNQNLLSLEMIFSDEISSPICLTGEKHKALKDLMNFIKHHDAIEADLDIIDDSFLLSVTDEQNNSRAIEIQFCDITSSSQF